MTSPQQRAPDGAGEGWRRLTWATLLAALLLRVLLAIGGGQGFWPDESRYGGARAAVGQFGRGETAGAWRSLIGTADHPLFRVVSLPAAWLDHRFGDNPARAAIYLSLFSVAALALIGTCARLAGAGRRESWMAVFLATGTNSLFYFSRHLLPYDVSLAFCMAALAAGLGPSSWGRSVGAGLLAGIGFLCYDGYWMLAGAVLVMHVLRAPGWKRAVGRAAFAGAGLLLPVAIVVGAARSLGADLVASFRQFSGSITQGDFGRGHAFVGQFLWSAERLVLVLWVAAAGYAAWRAVRDRAWGRPMGWLAMIAGLYFGMGAFSDWFRVFVVYGRIARVLAPFFCLLAAWSVNDLLARRSGSRGFAVAAAAALAAFVLAAAFNFSTPLGQAFPLDFTAKSAEIVAQDRSAIFRLMNADRLWDGGSTVVPPGEVVLHRRHPLQFEPYLFEGYDEAQRQALGHRDISMRLVRLSVPAPAPAMGGYSGPLHLRVRFPANRAGFSEPLITNGVYGNADILFVRYLDAGHVCFGYDCWNAGGPTSAPIAIDPDTEHELLVFFGAMMPKAEPASLGEPAGLWPRLRNDLLVAVDGRTVLAARVSIHESPPSKVDLGLNFAGGSTAGVSFSGTWIGVYPAWISEVTARLPFIPVSRLRLNPELDGYLGPLRMAIVLPRDRLPGTEPLVTAGRKMPLDGLFLIYGGDGTVRLGYAHPGAPVIRSEPLDVPTFGRLNLVLSVGALMPPAGNPFYAGKPSLEFLRDRVFVRLEGTTVLNCRAPTAAADPRDVQILSNQTEPLTSGNYFTGLVIDVASADAVEVLNHLTVVPVMAGTPGPAWEGYPGPLRFRVRFPDRPQGTGEPLLVSGTPGAGDIVFVRYEGAGRIRLGYDHWGVGGPVSEATDLGSSDGAHELVVSEGALFPEPASAFYKLHPEWRRLRDWVVIAVDGHPWVVAKAAAFPSSPQRILAGLNSIGASTAGSRFNGDITEMGRASPEQVLDWIDASVASRR